MASTPDCSTRTAIAEGGEPRAESQKKRWLPLALRSLPWALCLLMAQAGFEPAASLVLSESGLPVAYQAVVSSYPGWELNPQALGFKPSRSASWRTWASKAEAVGLEPTIRRRRTPVFRTGSSSCRMASSSGGWNRTNGLLVQSQASLPAATAPDRFSLRHRALHPSSGRRTRTSITRFKARQPTV